MKKKGLRVLIGPADEKFLKVKTGGTPEKGEVRETVPDRNGQKALTLFVSYDVVDSAACRDMDAAWPNLILGIFHEIDKSFDIFECESKCAVRLWRITGDKIIFTVEVQEPKTIVRFIQIANEILLTINERNRNASSFKNELFTEYRHVVRNITLKAAAWISIANMCDEPENCHFEEDESIYIRYQDKTTEWFREYYGSDIDVGFRLEKYSRSDRLILSFELAYLLEEYGEGEYLHIIAYENLKGVWRNRLYPIIWYHRPNKEVNSLRKSFGESFTYDAAVNDPLVQKYLDMTQNVYYRNAMSPMPAEMYQVGPETMKKIAADTGILPKLRKMADMCENPPASQPLSDSVFMEVDCVAVCYKIKDNVPRILVLKTKPQILIESSKWCFGSTAAHAGDSVTMTLIHGYDDKIGIKILPLMYDKNGDICLSRDDEAGDILKEDPVPIGLFEQDDLRGNGSRRKGIICVAKIEEDDKSIDSHMGVLYEEYKYITEAELDAGKADLFGKDDCAGYFMRTAKRAFALIEQFETK